MRPTDTFSPAVAAAETPPSSAPFPAPTLSSLDLIGLTAQERPQWSPTSPFRPSEAWLPSDALARAAGELLTELADEDFDHVLHEVVGHAALLEARADQAPGVALAGAAGWLDRLAGESERALEALADRLDGFDLASGDETALDQLLEGGPDIGSGTGLSELEDQFVGGLVGRAKRAVRKVAQMARRGVALATRFLPMGWLVRRLAGLARPLVLRLLTMAQGRLPAAIRPLAAQLASRLGLGPTAVPAAAPAPSTAPAPAPAIEPAGGYGPTTTDGTGGTFPPAGPEPAPVAAGPADGTSSGGAAGDSGAGPDGTSSGGAAGYPGAGPDAGDGGNGSVGPEAAGELFDLQLTTLFLAETPSELDRLLESVATEVAEGNESALAAAEAEPAAHDDPGRRLSEARATLARQLEAMTPGDDPTAEIEQFLPVAMMALKPALRTAVGVVGRRRIVSALAAPIAALARPHLGAAAASRISTPLADWGLRLLGLEVPPDQEAGLVAEALTSIVEDTAGAALSLPAEALSDGLQLAAAVETAFGRAASRYLPPPVLRADLSEREVDEAPGIWVLLPRAAAPCRPYRKYSHVFTVPISRQVADAIAWTDGGTLQSHLEDSGVTSWPAAAEIHLYETLPGVHPGHLALDGEGQPPDTEGGISLGGEAVHPSELQQLTPITAGLMLGHPRLGRPSHPGATRWFRVAVRGRRRYRRSHHRRRTAFRLLPGPNAAIRVAIRLNEREGQELAARLDRGELAASLAWFTRRTERYHSRLARLLGLGLARQVGLPPGVADVAAAARQVITALNGGLSAELTRRPNRLATAVQDPALGVTIVATVPLVPAGAAATVEVRPGWHRP